MLSTLDLMSTLYLCREPYTVAVLCIQKDQSTETAQVLSCYAGCKALGYNTRLSYTAAQDTPDSTSGACKPVTEHRHFTKQPVTTGCLLSLSAPERSGAKKVFFLLAAMVCRSSSCTSVCCLVQGTDQPGLRVPWVQYKYHHLAT